MQVWPTNDAVKKLIKHPIAGGFREAGPTEWPDDSFTYRRKMDGDITMEDPAGKTDAASEKASSKHGDK
jgi:hypothetical protein